MTLKQAEFVIWAKANGINMEHKDDWMDWWDCWSNGFNASIKLCATQKKEEPPIGALKQEGKPK